MSDRPNLIYDVGVCNGDDSAYYLHKGFKVVGIEANPLAVARLRQRFHAEIEAGRYSLLPWGIAQAAGEAPFWVCDDHPEWSSFDRSIASRNGSRHHCVTVTTCRLASVLERFGPATYCKIDIEGNEKLCLEDLTAETRPTFISTEVIDGDRQIETLRRLGYTRFKLISQRTLRQPSMAIAWLKAHVPRWPERLIVTAEAKLMRHRFDGAWRFPGGSSGPFGEATPGAWLAADQALRLHNMLDRNGQDYEWFDLHAA